MDILRAPCKQNLRLPDKHAPELPIGLSFPSWRIPRELAVRQNLFSDASREEFKFQQLQRCPSICTGSSEARDTRQWSVVWTWDIRHWTPYWCPHSLVMRLFSDGKLPKGPWNDLHFGFKRDAFLVSLTFPIPVPLVARVTFDSLALLSYTSAINDHWRLIECKMWTKSEKCRSHTAFRAFDPLAWQPTQCWSFVLTCPYHIRRAWVVKQEFT